MIRGILQFTLRIAFRCVLHRCKSQDIRCRESFSIFRVPPCGGVSDGLEFEECSAPPEGRKVRPPRTPERPGGGDGAPRRARAREGAGGQRSRRPLGGRPQFAGFARMCDNDPSAGSPTETLLRLLLPLNGKV